MSAPLFARTLRTLREIVHRVVHPEHVEERRQVEQLARTLSSLASSQSEQVEALRSDVRELLTRLPQLALDRDIRRIDRRLEQLGQASGRQYKVMSQALKRADWDEELRVDERRLLRRLDRLARSDQPVLVGPWSGEVGFELLYWIPFVTWALRHAGVAPDRIVVVSRGGPASWYGHLGGRYFDLFSYVSPEEFRARTEEQKKQRSVGAFDREMVRRVIRDAGLSRPFFLHPGLMYRLFNPFWKQKATVRRVETFTEYGPVAAPRPATLAGRLPGSYVAVRFYFSACFPDTPANRSFVESTVRTLAADTDVVLLNTGWRMDDHSDYTPGRESRIHLIDDLMRPADNLETQTAVIAGARAFVGTYGGYSYLAPLCGVPSVAFYSVREAFFAHHLELAERVFRRIGAGSLIPLDVRDVSLLRATLAGSGVVQP